MKGFVATDRRSVLRSTGLVAVSLSLACLEVVEFPFWLQLGSENARGATSALVVLLPPENGPSSTAVQVFPYDKAAPAAIPFAIRSGVSPAIYVMLFACPLSQLGFESGAPYAGFLSDDDSGISAQRPLPGPLRILGGNGEVATSAAVDQLRRVRLSAQTGQCGGFTAAKYVTQGSGASPAAQVLTSTLPIALDRANGPPLGKREQYGFSVGPKGVVFGLAEKRYLRLTGVGLSSGVGAIPPGTAGFVGSKEFKFDLQEPNQAPINGSSKDWNADGVAIWLVGTSPTGAQIYEWDGISDDLAPRGSIGGTSSTIDARVVIDESWPLSERTSAWVGIATAPPSPPPDPPEPPRSPSYLALLSATSVPPSYSECEVERLQLSVAASSTEAWAIGPNWAKPCVPPGTTLTPPVTPLSTVGLPPNRLAAMDTAGLAIGDQSGSLYRKISGVWQATSRFSEQSPTNFEMVAVRDSVVVTKVDEGKINASTGWLQEVEFGSSSQCRRNGCLCSDEGFQVAESGSIVSLRRAVNGFVAVSRTRVDGLPKSFGHIFRLTQPPSCDGGPDMRTWQPPPVP
jgi:hypothetical protein